SSTGRPSLGWPASAVDGWMATFFHRLPILNPSLKRIGIGYATTIKGNYWQVVVDVKSGVDQDMKQRREPVIFPTDKQTNVPLTLSFGWIEEPNPLPKGVNPTQCGYPVTVTFPEGARVENATVTLELVTTQKLPAFVSKAVPLFQSTPEKPAYTYLTQNNTVCG